MKVGITACKLHWLCRNGEDGENSRLCAVKGREGRQREVENWEGGCGRTEIGHGEGVRVSKKDREMKGEGEMREVMRGKGDRLWGREGRIERGVDGSRTEGQESGEKEK